MLDKQVLYIVLPCYNESEILLDSANKLLQMLTRLISEERVSYKSRVLFVDDGSLDNTWELIREASKNEYIEGIKLSGNRGHQLALFAGMEEACRFADAIITMDADLQQDINAIPGFLSKFEEGYDIVYGVRKNRDTDSLYKKGTANLYYKLMKSMGVKMIPQSADYRLMSRRAVAALCQYKETNMFLRGLIPSMGFRTTELYFDVHKREKGESKYTTRKMLILAFDGITSFSIKPIRVILTFGIVVSIISFGMIIYDLVTYIRGITISGWASLAISISFFEGVQLIALGIIGEYVGRTYLESKNRPRYFIEDRTMRTYHSYTETLDE